MYRLRLFSACHVGHPNTTDSARHQCSSVSSTVPANPLGSDVTRKHKLLVSERQYGTHSYQSNRCGASRATPHRTSHCPSLRIARHFALPVTSHYPSLRITRHFALPVTSHYPSLRITRHFAFPVTSHYPSLRITRHFASDFALPVTSHCASRRTATTLGTKTILFSDPTCQVSN